MSELPLRSALVIAVPQAASAVDGWREHTCHAKSSIGVPAHITILWPFFPAARSDDTLLAHLRKLFGAIEPFTFELATTARFPETLYLAPEPADRFIKLTRAVHDAYPDYPPYEVVFGSIVPHLTPAQGDDDVLTEAESDVLPRLPIVALAHEAMLIEEVEPESALWRPRATFPLHGAEN